ncbi:unnamed protein product [Didymodactylos carnosus]|uniref:Uncharacterized protein n=1 Tax=Didymodactylos carnosus TaxID=1234261 RepID=A0A8S2E0D5_9BILA|nr:unnamed protein product [Didymodactylos carnosus]CAF3820581.1 unnamed protein product [Didymodactylos carnosus]
MEQGCSLGLSKNVHIIPKISTHLALSYLDSGFGQQILRSNRNFRILSDMTRPDEENGGEAGAILMKELKRRGFEHSMMLFVFNEKNAKNAIKKHLGENVKGITITTDEDAAKAFIIGKN